MKKSAFLLMAIFLIMSITITAFAYDIEEYEKSSTITLTTEVPMPVPEFSLHIPASMYLEYGNTEAQSLGVLYVTNCMYFEDDDAVSCRFSFTDLEPHPDNEYNYYGPAAIPVNYTFDRSAPQNQLDEDLEVFGQPLDNEWIYGVYSNDTGSLVYSLYATVSEEAWKSAEPGIYTAQMRFDIILTDCTYE